jgi:hypothetical protein
MSELNVGCMYTVGLCLCLTYVRVIDLFLDFYDTGNSEIFWSNSLKNFKRRNGFFGYHIGNYPLSEVIGCNKSVSITNNQMKMRVE